MWNSKNNILKEGNTVHILEIDGDPCRRNVSNQGSNVCVLEVRGSNHEVLKEGNGMPVPEGGGS